MKGTGGPGKCRLQGKNGSRDISWGTAVFFWQEMMDVCTRFGGSGRGETWSDWGDTMKGEF